MESTSENLGVPLQGGGRGGSSNAPQTDYDPQPYQQLFKPRIGSEIRFSSPKPKELTRRIRNALHELVEGVCHGLRSDDGSVYVRLHGRGDDPRLVHAVPQLQHLLLQGQRLVLVLFPNQTPNLPTTKTSVATETIFVAEKIWHPGFSIVGKMREFFWIISLLTIFRSSNF